MNDRQPYSQNIEAEALDPDQSRKVEHYQERFGIRFTQFKAFSRERFAELHSFAEQNDKYSETILSTSNSDVQTHFAVFEKIANDRHPTDLQRLRYRQELLWVYKAIEDSGHGPETLVQNSNTLVVAPKREGYLLAKAMKWLPEGRDAAPDAKRIPDGKNGDGLLVALNDFHVPENCSQAVLIDGAVASGATLLAIMEVLRNQIKEFHIYCVHSTREALNAFNAYSAHHNLTIPVVAGHVTTGLSGHYYATMADKDNPARKRLVVGDLGDTIDNLPDDINPM